MSEPHVIRLRGPWLLEVLEHDPPGDGQQGLPAECKVAVPGDWQAVLGADFCGSARYSRRFNRPTNLEPHERVWLVLEAVDHAATVSLNGQSLGKLTGGQSPARFEITAALEPYNLLAVEVTLPHAVHGDTALRGARADGPGGLIGEVRLEIVAGQPR